MPGISSPLCESSITPTAGDSVSDEFLEPVRIRRPEKISKIALKNLTTGKTVVLDGETGTWCTENGELKSQDAQLWEAPSSKAGEHNADIQHRNFECNCENVSKVYVKKEKKRHENEIERSK